MNRNTLHSLWSVLKNLGRTRLSRRIVFWVFFSVILIEAIILIPSVHNREQELLEQLKMVSSARIDTVMMLCEPDATGAAILKKLEQYANQKSILGGVVFDGAGKRVGGFGEMPALSFFDGNDSAVIGRYQVERTRYDAIWPPSMLGRNFLIMLRHDAIPVRQELLAFILRIAGLVVIISMVVTGGAWIALHPIVINPISRLRSDLIAAGEAVSNDQQSPQFDSLGLRRPDELGDVIGAFDQMYRQVTEAITKRKHAENALQESLRQVRSYSRAMNQELEKGRLMQTHFLPPTLLSRPGWEFAAYFRPARQVAGDFYDVFELPDRRIGIVIADVCDKGVGAALFMALFRSLIRIFCGQAGMVCGMIPDAQPSSSAGNACIAAPPREPIDSLEAVRLTNNYIARNHGDLAMFATLFFGVLEPESGVLTFVNGGHDPLFVLGKDGGVRDVLRATGPAVGLMEDSVFQEGTTTLTAGEILVGYTDGVTEAVAPDGSFFTLKRMLSLLRPAATSAQEVIGRVVTDVRLHTGDADQFDDITMLAIRHAESSREN